MRLGLGWRWIGWCRGSQAWWRLWSACGVGWTLAMLVGVAAGNSAEPMHAQEADPRLQLRGQLAGPVVWAKPVVRDNVLFLGASGRVLAVDAGDPAAPRVVGEVELPTGAASPGGTEPVRALAADGDRIVAVTESRLHVVDAADPARLAVVETWPVSAALPRAPGVPSFDTLAGPLVVREGVAYVAGTGGIVYRGWGDWRIAAIDLHDSAGPTMRAVVELGVITGWAVSDMQVEGDELWLALSFSGQMGDTGNGGVQRWSLAEPGRPTLVQSVVAPRSNRAKTPPRWYEAHAIAVREGLVALGTSAPLGQKLPGVVNDQSGRGGLRLLASAPGGRDEMIPSGHWFAEDVITGLAWHGHHLFATTAADYAGFREGPGRVVLLGQGRDSAWETLAELPWEQSIRTLVKDGRRLYAIDAAGTLLVLETSLPGTGMPRQSRALMPLAVGE